MKRNQKLVFISIYCALAIVLDFIKSFIPMLNMPSGGSINIALIPIVVCSFHLGIISGIISGLLWWVISSLLGLNPYYISLMQYVVDYIFPSAVIGISSIFYRNKKLFEIEAGITFMMLVRTVLLIISGSVFWQEGVAAGSKQAFIASIIYNVPYSFATLIMLLIVIPFVLRSLKRFML